MLSAALVICNTPDVIYAQAVQAHTRLILHTAYKNLLMANGRLLKPGTKILITNSYNLPSKVKYHIKCNAKVQDKDKTEEITFFSAEKTY